MGATISTTYEGTGQRNLSLEHKESLARILQGLSKLCLTYPSESKVEFKRILTWTSTTLHPSNFADPLNYTTKVSSKYAFVGLCLMIETRM